MTFSSDVLQIDAAAEVAFLTETLRSQVLGELRKKGLVVGISGGIDSAVVAGLAARAFATSRVLGISRPPRDSSGDSLTLGREVAAAFELETQVEDIAPALDGIGCYARQEDAIRKVFPAYGKGWRCKITLPSVLEKDRLAISMLTVESPGGKQETARMPLPVYQQLVAATNFKQRVRKMMEYYHADRLGYAVAGTPNRLEYDQGFFVKQGDGAADVKPIAHLYKTQVYALAAYLGVPEEIRRRPPTTDTFSMPQTQDEFYFALPYDKMDLCLYARDHGVSVDECGAALGLTGAQVERVYRDIDAKRRVAQTLHAPPRLARPLTVGLAMCGIAGILRLGDASAEISREALLRMCSALHHRGPDERGFYRDAHVGLAHTRLSILDLATGQQPLCNEDGTLWIAFNGEIFDYVELREELRAKGHVFRTASDTEVIVHAYEEWGDEAFARFDGQFAIALWDATKKKLVLARDPAGILPLSVCEHAGRVVFGSEVRAIFAGDETIPRAFDPIGLAQTFTFWSVVPPQGVFEGVREILPGHVRTYEGGRVVERAFARQTYPTSREARSSGNLRSPSANLEEFPGTLDDAVDEVRRAMTEAVRLRQLRADVPVGSYLSGGLDSSFVAALGRAAMPGTFKTFSLRFEDAEYDETSYQRRMAEALGTEHAEILVRRADIAAAFPDAVRAAERPILRTAPVPLFLLSGLVRSHGVKVVLTGEGADEVFAGYDIFREAKVRRFWARHPESTMRPRLLERLYPYLARSPVAQRAIARKFFGRGLSHHREPGFSHGPRWETTSALLHLVSPAMRERQAGRDVVREYVADLPPELASWTTLAQDQHIEITTLLWGYLLSSQGDRMLMGHSIEGRFPFLDPHVMALARSLPPEYKLRVLDEKHVLKRASAHLVPDEIRMRKKQPYRAPDALAFYGPDAPAWIDEAMSRGAVQRAGVFDPGAVEALHAKCKARGASGQFSNTDNMAVVAALSTQILHDAFIASPPAVGPDVTPRTIVDRIA